MFAQESYGYTLMLNTHRIISLALLSSCCALTQCQQVGQQICYASVLPKAKHVQVVKTSPDYSSRNVLFVMKDGETSDDLQKKLGYVPPNRRVLTDNAN